MIFTTLTSTMPSPHTTRDRKPRQIDRRECLESLLWQAIGMRRVGTTYSAIPRLTCIPISTLATAWARYEKTDQVKPTTRTGRPLETTVREDRQLLITSKRERKITYEQLRQNFAGNVSVKTIKRRRDTFGVHKHIMAEKPKLTPYNARRCLR